MTRSVPDVSARHDQATPSHPVPSTGACRRAEPQRTRQEPAGAGIQAAGPVPVPSLSESRCATRGAPPFAPRRPTATPARSADRAPPPPPPPPPVPLARDYTPICVVVHLKDRAEGEADGGPGRPPRTDNALRTTQKAAGMLAVFPKKPQKRLRPSQKGRSNARSVSSARRVLGPLRATRAFCRFRFTETSAAFGPSPRPFPPLPAPPRLAPPLPDCLCLSRRRGRPSVHVSMIIMK